MSPIAARPRVLLFVFILCLGLFGAGALRLLAQQTPTRTVGAAATGATTVRFLAVNSDDGKPVTDLTPADIVLKVDGKARILKSLNFVSLANSAHGAAAPAESLPPPFTVNTAAAGPGRSVLFVVDLETIPTGGEVLTRQAIEKFLNSLGPNDQAGIQGIPHGGISVDMTSDLNRVRLALQNLIGQAVQGETATDGTMRSRDDLVQIQGILENFTKTETNATMVLVTSSLYGVSGTATPSQTSNGRGGGVVSDLGGSLLTQDYFDNVRKAAAAAQVQFFIVEPTNRAGATSGMNGATDGIQNLAAGVGAQPMQLSLPGNETAMDRILRETSGYYVATFDPDTNERNGFAHPLGLSSSRKGVTLRVTSDIALPKPGATKASGPTSPTDALKTATVYRDLPLRAVAYVRRNSADPVKTVAVIGVAEPIDPGTRFTAASAGLYNKTGTLVAQFKADSAALANPAFISQMLVAPGAYRLRIAATDSAGRTGTVDVQVDAGFAAAGPLKMSSLMLGVPSATGASTLQLQFSKEPQVLAAFELYGAQKGQQITMVGELAKTLDGPAILSSADGGIKREVKGTDQADKYAVTFTVPIEKLEPGDYIVRVIGGIQDQATTRIIHTLRKVGG